MKHPNFLYFMTDQHRADWLGCAGHPVLRTPNIDALADSGTRFDQFHVATPVCMPNRASFMTGRYPSVHGLRYNGCVLNQRHHSFVDVLRAGGYHTASIGKSHLQPFTDRAPMGRDPLDTGPIVEAWRDDSANYGFEQPGHYDAEGRYHFPTPYYGYAHVDMVTGHGDQCGGHYQQWFRERHPDWRELCDPTRGLAHDYTCPQAHRTPIPAESYPTAWIRDRAVDYLQAQAASDAPFFAFVSFPDPHHPFNPPGHYWDLYAPDDFPLETRFEDHPAPPPPLQHCHRQFLRGELPPSPQMPFIATERHLREAMALTAGMITMIDDAVGSVVEALKASGQFDNTVIIFNSDHGDYLGDCSLLLKGDWPRESINRVPMIWSDPDTRASGGQGQVCTSLASTVDIAPSILRRAGLKPYHGMQGRSFLDAIDGGATGRDELLIEYNAGGRRMGFDPASRVRTLLTDDWQLTIYKDEDWGELYHRREDPRCLNNLWDDPDHAGQRGELLWRLGKHLTAQMDESPRSQLLA